MATSRSDEPLTDRKAGQRDAVVQVELFHDVPAMMVDGPHAGAVETGDLLFQQPAREVSKDLPLACGQQLQPTEAVPNQSHAAGADL